MIGQFYGLFAKVKAICRRYGSDKCRKEPSTASAFFSFFVERKATK